MFREPEEDLKAEHQLHVWVIFTIRGQEVTSGTTWFIVTCAWSRQVAACDWLKLKLLCELELRSLVLRIFPSEFVVCLHPRLGSSLPHKDYINSNMETDLGNLATPVNGCHYGTYAKIVLMGMESLCKALNQAPAGL